jgi:nitroreductase
MDILSLEELIKSRRTIRRWKKQEVPDDLIKKAVEIATWAPNGGNYQGWQFVVIKNPKKIEDLANAVQSVADKIASWPEAAKWKEEMERYRKNSSFFRNAPVCIGVFVSQYAGPMDKALQAREPADAEARRIISYRRSAPTSIQSAAAAVTTMLLLFHQMGLGAVWLGGPLVAKREIEEILKSPKEKDLVCLVALGYPDESPQRDRRPVEEVIQFIR